jgi:hypothetical protein
LLNYIMNILLWYSFLISNKFFLIFIQFIIFIPFCEPIKFIFSNWTVIITLLITIIKI